MKTTYRIATVLCLCLSLCFILFTSSVVKADGIDFQQSHFTVKAGVIGSGPVDLRDFHTVNETAVSLGACFDYPIGSSFFFDFGVDFYRMNWVSRWELRGQNSRATMAEINVGLKQLMLLSGSGLALRPGLSLGFGSLGEMNEIKGSSYLTGRISIEALVAVSKKLGLAAEAAMWSSLSGSDNDQDISLGPEAVLRLGLVF